MEGREKTGFKFLYDCSIVSITSLNPLEVHHIQYTHVWFRTPHYVEV